MWFCCWESVGISFVTQYMASFCDYYMGVLEKNTYSLFVEDRLHVHVHIVLDVSKTDKVLPQKLMFPCLHVYQASLP